MRISARLALERIYTREQLWRAGMVALGGGTLLPLALLLVGDSPPLLLGAAAFLLLGSLFLRYLLIMIPHRGPSARGEHQ